MLRYRAAAIAALAPVAIYTTPAAAQPLPVDTIDQTATIERINEATAGPALAVVTGNQVVGADPQGNPTLIATATNGLRFEVNFRACEDGASEDEGRHCKAMYMMSVWDSPGNTQAPEYQAAVAAYLQSHPTINVSQLADGSPYIVRYVITDFGTQQGNLLSEFSNFVQSATDFQNAIASFYSEAE